jgi:hypothetical protein
MKRFSLASLLLFAAVVALGTALLVTTSQLKAARVELSKLRNDIRTLDPSAPDKMRAIEIPSFGRNQWRWRIDLPDSDNFVLRWAYNDIPIDRSLPGQVDPKYNHPKFVAPKLPNDEFILTIGAINEENTWMLGVKTESASSMGGIDFATEMSANDSTWLSRRGGNSVHNLAGTKETAVNPVDSPFVLLRYRKGLSPSSGVTAMDPNPTDGILVWIERSTATK